MSDFNTNDIALTALSIMQTDSKGNPTTAAALTNGQLLIGSTGLAPVAASLTAGSGVSITPGAGTITIAATGSGGTVTSVALALPSSILTVSGSPVTTSGTLTGTLATQTANTVWAGPTTGAAATPTFRALVSADIPSLSGLYANVALSNLTSPTAVNQTLQPTSSGSSDLGTTGAHWGALWANTTNLGSAAQVTTAANGQIVQTYTESNNDGGSYGGTTLNTLFTGSADVFVSAFNVNLDSSTTPVYTGTGTASTINATNFAQSTGYNLNSGGGNFGSSTATIPVSGAGLSCGANGQALSFGFTGTMMGVFGQSYDYENTATVSIGVAGQAATFTPNAETVLGGYFTVTDGVPDTLPIPTDLAALNVALVAQMDPAFTGGELIHGYSGNTRLFTVDYTGSTFFQGSLGVGYTPIATSSTIKADRSIVGVTSTASPVTVTLPSAVPGSVPGGFTTQAGCVIIVKDESGGALLNNITVAASGGQTIDGSASVTITQNYGVVRLYSNGTEWFTI